MDEASQIKTKFFKAGFILLVMIITGIVMWLLSRVATTVTILVASIFLAYLLSPMVNFFENPIHLTIPAKINLPGKEKKLFSGRRKVTIRKVGFSRLWSVIIVYLILALLFILVMSFVVPNLIYEFNNFLINFPRLSQQIQDQGNEFYQGILPRLPEASRDIVPKTIEKYTNDIETYIYQGAQYTFGLLQKMLSAALAMMIIPIFTFYILMDMESFKSAFRGMLPPKNRHRVMELMNRIDFMLGRYIRGQILVSAFVAVAITIALLAMGIDYAFLIGLLSGVVNFIPYLGVIISLIPALTLAFISRGFLWVLLVFIVLQIIQQIEGQIVSPAVMGEAVGLPPLVIILALIVGGQTMGLLGLLVAIPLVAAVRVIFEYYSYDQGETQRKIDLLSSLGDQLNSQ